VNVARAANGKRAAGRRGGTRRQGESLAHRACHFAAGAGETSTKIALPLEMRKRSGGIVILTRILRRREVSRRRAVEMFPPAPLRTNSRCSPTLYLDAPFAPTRCAEGNDQRCACAQMSPCLFSQKISARSRAPIMTALARFRRAGGVSCDSAGDRIRPCRDFVPVKLRVGAAISEARWPGAAAASLAQFSRRESLRRLSVPGSDVSKQIPGEPSIELADRSWARLADGSRW